MQDSSCTPSVRPTPPPSFLRILFTFLISNPLGIRLSLVFFCTFGGCGWGRWAVLGLSGGLLGNPPRALLSGN